MNGAQTLAQTLVHCGVDVCFANPGTSEMHFVAALDAVEGDPPGLCLFEGVATGAADAYGRIACKPAATLLHLGPGLANGLRLRTVWQARSSTWSAIVMPYAKVSLAMIDVRDTGAVGARILIDPAPHVGKSYEFTGATTNYGAFTDVYAQVRGRKNSYAGVTTGQNEQAMKARGMPNWLVAHLTAIARIVRSGGASSENTKPIYDIVKRAPLTTKQFVEDHKALFA